MSIRLSGPRYLLWPLKIPSNKTITERKNTVWFNCSKQKQEVALLWLQEGVFQHLWGTRLMLPLYEAGTLILASCQPTKILRRF